MDRSIEQPFPPQLHTVTMLASRLAALLVIAAAAHAQGASAGVAPPSIADDPGEQIPGPANPGDQNSVAAWRDAMVAWRTRMREKISYNGSIYDVPELKWTQTSCKSNTRPAYEPVPLHGPP